MTSEEDEFAQFESELEPPKKTRRAPAKKAAAKKAAAKPPEPPAAPRDEESESAASHDARVEEALAVADDDGIERVTVVVTKSSATAGASPDEKRFETRVPRDQGEWDGRVLWLLSKGRQIDGFELLLGSAEFARFLDVIQPKQKEIVKLLDDAIAKALGVGGEGN